MNVLEMERRFFELKGKFDVGAISEDEFKAEIAKLQFEDKHGRRWMIGAQSGKWYVNEGARWIPGAPPGAEPPPPEPRKTAVSVSARPESLRAPARPRVAPAMPTPALPTLPITGPLLIVAAGVAALVVVLIAWLAIDLMVPGRPISSFFGGVTSGTNAPRPAAPTSVAALPVSNNAAAIIAMGDTLFLQSRVDAAITQYQNASQITQTNPLPLSRWSRALAMRGQAQDALTRAQQATQRAPNDAESNAQLCRAQLWSGATDDAIQTCNRAVQQDSKNVNAHAFLAEAYLHAGRQTDALAQAQLALQLAPNSAEAHRAQAWVLTIQGQKENAFAEWKQTTVLEPDLFFRHYEFAEALRVYLGNPADAIPAYQKSIALYGAYIPAIQRLGLALLEAKKPLEAVPHLQRALTLDPNNAAGYTYLGIAFAQANQCNQALPYFDQALKLDPNNSIAQTAAKDCKAGTPVNLPAPAPPTVPLLAPTLVPAKP